jgi:polygalacturonase
VEIERFVSLHRVGRVLIPPGKWLSRGPIHLASCIDLHLAEGATLIFSPEARHYLPVVLTRWEGTELYGYSPLVYAFEVHDVAITGTGVIDGNAASEFLTWVNQAERDQLALRRTGVDGTPVAQRVFGRGRTCDRA